MSQNYNTLAKQAIRSEWCKPILEFLHKKLSKKLIYLGLPSENPEDIYDWIDFLDEVYAFQCREYPKPSNESQERTAVIALEKKLRELERKGKLSYSVVFDGYIEEVVLRGYDNNPTWTTFGHENTITIYNLDFCNQITSPITYLQDGKEKQAYKFDVIKELLHYQKAIQTSNKKFVLFLTIHANYKDNHVTRIVEERHSSYNKKIANLKGLEKKSRMLKAYIFDIMQRAFENYYFRADFLPVIRYEGISNYTLLHFTVIGTEEATPGGLTSQKIDNFLNQKFITFDEKKFCCLDTLADEINVKNFKAVELFQKTETFKQKWNL